MFPISSDHPLVRSAKRERARMRLLLAPPLSPAAESLLDTLASGVRLARDLGNDAKAISRSIVAGHRAMLRELAKADPALACKVADEVRPIIKAALAHLV